MMMSKGPLMSPPKHPFKKVIQFYLEITLQMTGCKDTRGSRTSFSWIPFCNQERWPII